VSEQSEHEGVRVTDKRRIDPDTFEVREVVQESESPLAAGSDPLADETAAANELDSEIQELTATLQRVSAEYANYRKRVDRDREVIRDMAVASVLSELLPVLDDLDRAKEHGELQGAFKTVGETLQSVVTKLGLERYGTAPEPFDPEIHEALGTESREDIAEPTVVTVYQSGYRFATRVLRPARVVVAGTD